MYDELYESATEKGLWTTKIKQYKVEMGIVD